MDETLTDQEKKVLLRLQSQCSKREYCVKDVMDKAVKALEGDSDAARRIVDELVKEKYVDNLRYASAFAREKASLSGWGDVKIRYMLAAKGITGDIVTEALGEIDEGAASRKLENTLKAKYRTVAEDPDCKLKLLKFALSRGYSYDEVKEVVEKVMKGEED